MRCIMLIDVLKQCLLEFYDIGIPNYNKRDYDIIFIKNMVLTIVGGRKVGKTYLTYQIIDNMLKEGFIHSLSQVCYLHFDDERLLEMQVEDLKLIDEAFLEISNATPKTNLVFVFDEIHRIPNWEFFVLRLNRCPNWRVVVTGSSSQLEEDRIGKQLRGKTQTIHLHPLSFTEFINFKNDKQPGKNLSVSETAHYNALFLEYMDNGSYPAMTDIPDQQRRDILRQYFNSIVASDLINNHDIRHALSCKLYLRNLLQKNASPYTHKKERNTLASVGHNIPANTIANWFNWAQEAYLIGVNTIDSPSIKKQEQNYRKIYAIDWALAAAVNSFREDRKTAILESIVYWHLIRQGMMCCYSLTGTAKYEVDFIVGPQSYSPELAIQVCLDVSNPETLERETNALDYLRIYYKNIEPVIITLASSTGKIQSKYPIKRIIPWLYESF